MAPSCSGGGAPTTPTDPDDEDGPCDEAKKMAGDSEYSEQFEKLSKKTDAAKESGFQTDWEGNIVKMDAIDETSMKMDIEDGIQSADHVHNDIDDPEKFSVKAPSPKDINVLFNLAHSAYQDDKDYNKVSIGTVSSKGNYKIYYTGTEDELKDLPYNAGGGGKDSLLKLNKRYRERFEKTKPMSQSRREETLLKFLEEDIGTNNISAVLVDNHGVPEKTIAIDKNGKISVTNC